MSEGMDRLGNIERKLDAVAGDVETLKTDVGTLKTDVGTLKADVGTLKGDVHRSQVSFESHETKIGTIAEVQAHHGRQLDEHGKRLDEIRQSLEPLGAIHDFVKRIASDHEGRLQALERAR